MSILIAVLLRSLAAMLERLPLLGPAGLMLAAPLLVVLLMLVKKLWLRDALQEPTELPGEGSL